MIFPRVAGSCSRWTISQLPLRAEPHGTRDGLCWGAILWGLLLVAGCGPAEPVLTYEVPKEPPSQQMLVTMVAGDRGLDWFFKIVGPHRTVAENRASFDAFLEQLKFESGEPSWGKLPEGWRVRPGRQGDMRYATIEIETKDFPLEMTVIPLPRPPGIDEKDFELSQVNRWRRQLSLPPIDLKELEGLAQRHKVGAFDSLSVVLEGEPGRSGMGPMMGGEGGAPFAGGGAPGGGGAPRGDDGGVTYERPESWSDQPLAMFSVATFGAGEAQVTVSSVRGGLAANFNRWRDQVGKSAVAPSDVPGEFRPIETAAGEALYTELTAGPEDADLMIAVAVLQREGADWYIRLKGPQGECKRQLETFHAFLKTIRFKEES